MELCLTNKGWQWSFKVGNPISFKWSSGAPLSRVITTPGKLLYFQPFLGAQNNFIYNDHRGPSLYTRGFLKDASPVFHHGRSLGAPDTLPPMASFGPNVTTGWVLEGVVSTCKCGKVGK